MKFRGLAVIGVVAKLEEMSRRSRRRKPAGGGAWWGRAVVVSLIVCVLGLGVGYAMLRRYLHSDSFRKFLSVEAGDMAGVIGEFAPFQWDGLAVETESFEAKGEGVVTGLRADGLHTEVGFGGVSRGVWEIKGTTLKRLEVFVDMTKTIGESITAEVKRDAEKPVVVKSGWLPRDAELQGLDVGEVVVRANLEEGQATASGLAVQVDSAGGKNAYRGEVRGGTVRLPYKIVPELRVDRLKLRYQDGALFLTDATVLAWKNGRIEGSGEWDMESRQFSFEGGASGMTCNDIFNDDWAKRMNGDVSSTFVIANTNGSPAARGNLTIQGGVITALPLLDALAAYADTRRFRVLNLNEAHTDWHWKKGELILTHLVLSSDGLVRLEGALAIRGREIDGLFRLGLAQGTLASIPGAETDVFIAGERGLLWSPLRITGTLDDPKEDLTDRLIAAAGLRMFDQIPDTGEKVIKFTRSILGDDPNKTIDKGVRIIEEGSGLIRSATGVLDGFLGGGDDERPKEEKK